MEAKVLQRMHYSTIFHDFLRISLSWGYRFIKLDVYWNSFQRSLKHTFGDDNRNACKTICGGKFEEPHALKKKAWDGIVKIIRELCDISKLNGPHSKLK